jgi:hypothetical protein
MSISVIVKSILSAEPYYQCITHMMPREQVGNDGAHVSESTSAC